MIDVAFSVSVCHCSCASLDHCMCCPLTRLSMLAVVQASDLDGTACLINGAGGWRALNHRNPAAEAMAAAAPEDSSESAERTESSMMPRSGPAPPAVPNNDVPEPSEEALGEATADGGELVAVQEADRLGEGDADDSDSEENWEEELEAAARVEQKKGQAPAAGSFALSCCCCSVWLFEFMLRRTHAQYTEIIFYHTLPHECVQVEKQKGNQGLPGKCQAADSTGGVGGKGRQGSCCRVHLSLIHI